METAGKEIQECSGPGPPCDKPPPDRVLRLAWGVLILGFSYLALAAKYPDLKEGSAVIAIMTGMVTFYFGGTYLKGGNH